MASELVARRSNMSNKLSVFNTTKPLLSVWTKMSRNQRNISGLIAFDLCRPPRCDYSHSLNRV